MKKITSFFSKPENIFLVAAGFFGLLSVFLMPVLNTPDENQHFQVEYGMFTTYDGVPRSVVENEQTIRSAVENNDYQRLMQPQDDIKNDGVQINLDNKVFGDVKSSALDIARLPSAIGILLTRMIHPSVFAIVSVGRIVNLVIFVLAIYFVIKKSKRAKWAIMAITCIPMVIQQAASLSYDGINFIAIIIWVAICYSLWQQKKTITNRQILYLIASFGLLLVTKPNNVLFVILMLGVPKAVYKDIPLLKKIRKHRYKTAIYIICGILATAIVVAGVYIMGKRFLAGQEFHLIRLLKVLINTLLFNTNLIDVTSIGMFGQFGHFNYSLPIWVIMINIIAIIFAFSSDKEKFTNKQVILATAAFMLSILMIMVGMYYAWAMLPKRFGALATTTDGIQGRYFTPFLILLLPLTTYFLRADNKIKKLKIAALFGILLSLIVYTLQTIFIIWVFKWKVL